MKPLEIKKNKLTPLSEKKIEPKKEEQDNSDSKGIQPSDILYMESKKGNTKDFAQCSSCWKFTGKSCLEFEKGNTVKSTATCGLYAEGKPRTDMIGQETGATTKEESGYIEATVTCKNCEYFEKADHDCLVMRILNIKKYKVSPDGCCNLWSGEGKD